MLLVVNGLDIIAKDIWYIHWRNNMSEDVQTKQLAKILSMSEDDARRILIDVLYDEGDERREGFFEVLKDER